MNQFFGSNTNGFNQSGCPERPRLRKILENAMDYPLVVVCAGSGYGKTRAVYSFLQEYDAYTTWIQLSDRDNTAARYWENYVQTTAQVWPKTGERLAEIGFPDTESAFAKYDKLLQEAADHPGKHVAVFDDFHLLRNPAVLRFLDKALIRLSPNTTVILISRTIPDINMIGMMMRGRVFTINEETLCFTEDEIAGYFNGLKLSVTGGAVHSIYKDTQGWAFAVNLIGRSLQKQTKYERCALEAMKANIFRLIEAEISETLSERLRRFLLRISLIDHLAAGFIKTLANENANERNKNAKNKNGLIEEMELINAYIRYDFHMDAYMMHHLFLDYLRQNQYLLTEWEKRETYRKAGEWCDANGYHMDALSYYEKSGDYDAIVRKIASFNVQIPPDTAKYALELFDNAPNEVKFQNPVFPGLHIRLRINAGRFDEDSIALARKYAEFYEAKPDSFDRRRALSVIYVNWALLRMCMCTYDDVYDFDVYFKKFGECYGKNPFETIGAYNLVPISAWASLVGTSRAGAQEEYLAALGRSVPAASVLGKGFFAGFDGLARGELCFYRGEFDIAEQYLKQAADKARLCDQYVTLSRALAYLMRISFFRGDFGSAAARLLSMEALLSEKDHGVRYTMYDIACGFYQLAMGCPDQVPEWLKGDFSPCAHPAYIENYANRIKAQYHYQKRKYNALLAYIESELGQRTVLFGKIELMALRALSLYQLKRHGEAVSALAEAYTLAEPNGLAVLFIQYSKDMRTLAAAALRDKNCPIPKAWLEGVNRKASAFAKRRSHMISEYMAANNIKTEFALTKRETEVLRDLSQGLSRAEIAASQDISINTVKMVINVIYDKLHANNLPDVIRIAVDRKII